MNLDYVMFGVFGVPLYREHTCFEDGDYCDFKLKMAGLYTGQGIQIKRRYYNVKT